MKHKKLLLLAGMTVVTLGFAALLLRGGQTSISSQGDKGSTKNVQSALEVESQHVTKKNLSYNGAKPEFPALEKLSSESTSFAFAKINGWISSFLSGKNVAEVNQEEAEKNASTLILKFKTERNAEKRLRELRAMTRNSGAEIAAATLAKDKTLFDVERIAALGTLYRSTQDAKQKHEAKHRLIAIALSGKSVPSRIYALKELRMIVARDKVYSSVLDTIRKSPKKYGKELSAAADRIEQSIKIEFSKS